MKSSVKNYKLQIHDQEQPKNGNFVLFRIVPYLDIFNFFGGAFRALCLCILRGVAVLHVTFFVELLDVVHPFYEFGRPTRCTVLQKVEK